MTEPKLIMDPAYLIGRSEEERKEWWRKWLASNAGNPLAADDTPENRDSIKKLVAELAGVDPSEIPDEIVAGLVSGNNDLAKWMDGKYAHLFDGQG